MHGEFSVERRAMGIQARASMKQKVEREIMNDRVSHMHCWRVYNTHVYIYVCAYVCVRVCVRVCM